MNTEMNGGKPLFSQAASDAFREHAIANNQTVTSIPANHKQVDGTHYKGKKIQPWDFIVANDMGFLEGAIIKYVSRYQDKNGVRDLEKAKHFLEKLIEVRSEGIGGA